MLKSPQAMLALIAFAALAGLVLLNTLSGAAVDPEAAGFLHMKPEGATQRAKSEGRYVLIEFYSQSCPHCRRLREETWPNGRVQTWLENNAVPVRVNAEKEPQLAERFGVESVPHTVITNANGLPLMHMRGYMTPDKFLESVAALERNTK